MPRFRVEYGLQVPAYGETEIEAPTVAQLIIQVKKLYAEEKLIDGWNTHPDVGCEDHRVIHVFQNNDDGAGWVQIPDLQFGLDDEDYYEDKQDDSPVLHVVWDDDSDSILGYSCEYDEAKDIADQVDDVRILKVRL